MNIEETKKIIQNKIQADEAAREVRSQIKTYIHEKQNVREGFTETFKPLIETSEKVKESIDTQQNKLIKQLQENQLALTQGLEGNKLAITSGFDKMDEVKKSDLLNLPDYEAIEHPEIKKTEEPGYWISRNDLKLLFGGDKKDFTPEDENLEKITKEQYFEILSQNKLGNDKYGIKANLEDPIKPILKVVEKVPREEQKGVVLFDDTDLDRGLLGNIQRKILKDLKLKLPSKLLNEKLEVITIYQRNADIHQDYFRDLLRNKAIFYTEKGVNKAKALNENPRKDTEKQIENYNVLGDYINNISNLGSYAEKTGQGIIHFNNPQQLVKRLELLAGSILAGNNGVKQEFSQIAHLLHQLKVITKKTLNDLLKKYILFK